MKIAEREVPFDLSDTEILNAGYVDLHVGRQVEVTDVSENDEEGFGGLHAL